MHTNAHPRMRTLLVVLLLSGCAASPGPEDPMELIHVRPSDESYLVEHELPIGVYARSVTSPVQTTTECITVTPVMFRVDRDHQAWLDLAITGKSSPTYNAAQVIQAVVTFNPEKYLDIRVDDQPVSLSSAFDLSSAGTHGCTGLPFDARYCQQLPDDNIRCIVPCLLKTDRRLKAGRYMVTLRDSPDLRSWLHNDVGEPICWDSSVQKLQLCKIRLVDH